MSFKCNIDKTKAALVNTFDTVSKTHSFLKSLSVKSKINVDCRLKSTKKIAPLYKVGFGCDKEIRIMPIIYTLLGLFAIITVFSACEDD
jgi:hypothetical protein